MGQLEIFSTILEPLNHRDYKTQALRRYPSAPFKVNNPSKVKQKKKAVKETKSAKSNISQKIPLIVTDDVGRITDVKTITGLLKEKNPNNAKQNEGMAQEQNLSQHSTKTAEQRKSNTSLQHNLSADKKYEDHLETSLELADAPTSMDQFISFLSSSILMSALNEASTVSLYDKFQFSNSREASATSIGRVKIEEPNEAGKKEKAKEFQEERKNEDIIYQSLTRENTMKSSASKLKSRPATRSSQASSARFLGGTLEFTTDDYFRKCRQERSCSSLFRHSAFASSVASTTDFFNKKKLSKLGLYVLSIGQYKLSYTCMLNCNLVL